MTRYRAVAKQPMMAESPEILTAQVTRRSWTKNQRHTAGRNARSVLPKSDRGSPIANTVRTLRLLYLSSANSAMKEVAMEIASKRIDQHRLTIGKTLAYVGTSVVEWSSVSKADMGELPETTDDWCRDSGRRRRCGATAKTR